MDLPPKKTLRRIAEAGTARFLTFSCYRRLPLFNNDRIKGHFVERMSDALQRHAIELIAWVTMPEHVHLIVYANEPDLIPDFLRTLKRPFARTVLDHWRAVDAPILPRLRDRNGETHFWQMGGGYDRNVIDTELLEKIKYVHSNPVDRGLVSDSVAWRWSSASAYRESIDVFGPMISFDLVPTTSRDIT